MLPNDKLPNVVCEECRDQLDSCYRFRRMARKSQKSLRNFVEYTEKLNGSPQVSLKFLSLFLLRVCNISLVECRVGYLKVGVS